MNEDNSVSPLAVDFIEWAHSPDGMTIDFYGIEVSLNDINARSLLFELPYYDFNVALPEWEKVTEHILKEGAVILKQGDKGTSLFSVLTCELQGRDFILAINRGSPVLWLYESPSSIRKSLARQQQHMNNLLKHLDGLKDS